MHINRLSITNIQGISALEIKPSAPVVLLSGGNHTGKTSTLDAIDMALTGNVSRVRLKKDYKQAVREGQRIGTVLLDWDEGRCGMTLPHGKHEIEGESPHSRIGGVLNMQHFSKMDETHRRIWLYGVMGLGLATTAEAVVDTLKSRGMNPDKADEVLSRLVTGFQSGEKYAQEQASQERGGWKFLTGQSYGDKKAEAWAPTPVEAPSPEDLAAAQAAAESAGAALCEASEAVGAINAKHIAYVAAQRQIESLTEEASKIDRIRDKLERDRSELKVWSDKLEALPPAPGVTPITHACPECGSVLVMKSGKLEHFDDAGNKTDPDVELRRIEQQKAVDLYRKAVEAGERNLISAQRAAVQAETLAQTEVVGESDVEAAKKRLEDANAARRDTARAYDALLAADNESKDANTKADLARAHHKNVQEWLAIADALSPDGIPAEIVGKAIGRLNKLLREYADTTDWLQVAVSADMTITGNGRLYTLLSESEQYRVDAMLTAAFAELTTCKFFVLDRLDVLHPYDRPTALMWLAGLAEAGRIDQVWVAATLKTEPTKLPDGVMCVWLSQEDADDKAEAA